MSQVPIGRPSFVASAQDLADSAGFHLSCEPEVGALLSVLTSTVPAEGRILELGTGTGVGLAWMLHGLGSRRDVEVVSVDIDPEIQAAARQIEWPTYVQFEVGDAAELVATLGHFHLIFADAPGGKIFKLRRTIDALEPGGLLVVDDMDLAQQDDADLQHGFAVARERLLSNENLVCAELAFSSGVILAAKRR